MRGYQYFSSTRYFKRVPGKLKITCSSKNGFDIEKREGQGNHEYHGNASRIKDTEGGGGR
jgi:hypothetical protein